jgi:LAS superfamily LD-carboxypeptidase LdcB
MKRYIPFLFLAVPFFIESCTEENKQPSSEGSKKIDQEVLQKKEVSDTLEKAIIPNEIPSNTKQPLPQKTTKKEKTIPSNANNIENAYPESKDLRFNNPSLDKWSSTYLNDPQWRAQYSESVAYYLASVQRNLDQNPQRKTDKSTIVSNYREKMSQTFYRSPEFVEFARSQFEKSDELSDFIVRNAGQITVN